MDSLISSRTKEFSHAKCHALTIEKIRAIALNMGMKESDAKSSKKEQLIHYIGEHMVPPVISKKRKVSPVLVEQKRVSLFNFERIGNVVLELEGIEHIENENMETAMVVYSEPPQQQQPQEEPIKEKGVESAALFWNEWDRFTGSMTQSMVTQFEAKLPSLEFIISQLPILNPLPTFNITLNLATTSASILRNLTIVKLIYGSQWHVLTQELAKKMDGHCVPLLYFHEGQEVFRQRVDNIKFHLIKKSGLWDFVTGVRHMRGQLNDMTFLGELTPYTSSKALCWKSRQVIYIYN